MRSSGELWDEVDGDLYDVLSLPRGASDAEVQRAWRRTARVAHPDAGGDVHRFRAVHVAFLVLSDPRARARYDARYRDPPPSPAPRQPLPVRFLVSLALVVLGCVTLSYLWPAFTLVTGVAVGAFVLIRYYRHWQNGPLP